MTIQAVAPAPVRLTSRTGAVAEVYVDAEGYICDCPAGAYEALPEQWREQALQYRVAFLAGRASEEKRRQEAEARRREDLRARVHSKFHIYTRTVGQCFGTQAVAESRHKDSETVLYSSTFAFGATSPAIAELENRIAGEIL